MPDVERPPDRPRDPGEARTRFWPFGRPRAGRSFLVFLRILVLTVWGCAAATALGRSQLGRSVELFFYNLLFEYRFAGQLPPPPEEVALVAVDDQSLTEFDHRWPLPRRLYARVVDRLKEAGARVIVLDVLFREPADEPQDDEALASAIARAGNVVLASTIEKSETQVGTAAYDVVARRNPLPALKAAAAALGIASQPLDPDGYVRRGWALVPGADPGGGRETLAGAALRLADPRANLPEGDVWINFRGPPGVGIRKASFYQVLEGTAAPGLFRNRIVYVGKVLSAEPDLREADSFLVPYFRGSENRMAGVEIQANLFSTLAHGDRIRPVSKRARGLMIAGEVAAAAALFLVFRPAAALVAAAVLVLLHWALAWRLFAHGLWVPASIPPAGVLATFLADTLVDYFTVERERSQVRRAFAQYMDPSLLAEVLRNPKRLKLGGEEVVGTILFTDLQGFTSMAEKMTPGDLVGFLNEYFTEMLAVIRTHRGTFDKFIGDAIMAFWGIPVRSNRHASDACLAALAMQHRMERLNRVWEGRGLPALTMRIGIATGPVVAGNMGSRDLFDYTVMGDTVNLASRLEGANKIYGSRILAAQPTREALGGEIVVRELDLVAVKGRQEALRIVEIVGKAGETGEEWIRMIDLFTAGLRAYQGRRWEEAIERFGQALAVRPEDQPSRLYIERCEACLRSQPPADWSGVFRMETK